MFINFSMYKLLPIFLFAFGFAETVEVYYQTDTPIAGFQFNVSGIVITDVSGGEAGKAGFMMSNSATTALGFSLSGTTIFVGKGKLLEIGYVENEPAGDDDAAVAPFDCASAVANFGCDFNWGGITISEACPESCGTKTYGIKTIMFIPYLIPLLFKKRCVL